MYLENPDWRVFRSSGNVKQITLIPDPRYSNCKEEVTVNADNIGSLEIVNTKVERMVIQRGGLTRKYYDNKTSIIGHVDSKKLEKLAKNPYSDLCYIAMDINYDNGSGVRIHIPNDNTNGNLCSERDDIRRELSSQDIILKNFGKVKLNFTSEEHNYNNVDDDY